MDSGAMKEQDERRVEGDWSGLTSRGLAGLAKMISSGVEPISSACLICGPTRRRFGE